jgi:hypothetical protein
MLETRVCRCIVCYLLPLCRILTGKFCLFYSNLATGLPSANQNVEPFLLIEPTVLSGPDSVRISQADIISPHNKGYNLVNLAQGDL